MKDASELDRLRPDGASASEGREIPAVEHGRDQERAQHPRPQKIAMVFSSAPSAERTATVWSDNLHSFMGSSPCLTDFFGGRAGDDGAQQAAASAAIRLQSSGCPSLQCLTRSVIHRPHVFGRGTSGAGRQTPCSFARA